MAILYKLTDKNYETMNHTKWGEGISHSTDGRGELCGPGWLHAYTSPYLAILLNPIHGNIKNPVLWLAEGEIEKTDRGLKVGTTHLKTISKMDVPKITTEQRVRFGLLCAKIVYKDPKFLSWADSWLNNQNRYSNAAAWAAAEAAAWAAEATTSALNLDKLAYIAVHGN